MVDYCGRRVAAHFGSPASEATVCLRTVGMADRWDRVTLELRGEPMGVEECLDGLGTTAWSARVSDVRALVRCERADEPACLRVLAHAEDVSRLDVSSAVAAIQLIGPRAWRLLDAGHLADAVVVLEAPDRYEVLTAAGDATVVWRRLLEAGRPHGLACVGLEALGHLAASGRLRRRTRSG